MALGFLVFHCFLHVCLALQHFQPVCFCQLFHSLLLFLLLTQVLFPFALPFLFPLPCIQLPLGSFLLLLLLGLSFPRLVSPCLFSPLLQFQLLLLLLLQGPLAPPLHLGEACLLNLLFVFFLAFLLFLLPTRNLLMQIHQLLLVLDHPGQLLLLSPLDCLQTHPFQIPRFLLHLPSFLLNCIQCVQRRFGARRFRHIFLPLFKIPDYIFSFSDNNFQPINSSFFCVFELHLQDICWDPSV
mmetsp:Transcript_26181/g.34406  ORF Transcript_26181/g.34406 Transcript_26181/m.34406 type:complete len:240 (+) Transcript_26181:282-1001(+)